MNTDAFDPALRRLIAVVLLGGIMGILDATMVSVAADHLVGEFGSTLGSVGWVSTGYLLALTVTVPVTAWAAGRFGSRRPWLAGLTLFIAGSLACAFAANLPQLVAFRIVQGVGAGIVDPLVMVILARGAGPARAGRVMGIMGVVLSLGPVLGPALGGLVLDGLGWRWMFLINLPVGVVAFALALRIVPRDEPAAPDTRLDLVGLALLGPGFAAVLLGLSRVAGQGGAGAWAPFAAGAVLLAGYAVRALTVKRTPPLLDLRLFTRPAFSASVGIMALSGLVTFGLMFLLPLYYQQAHGHGARVAGLLVAPVGLGASLAMPIAGRLSDRVGSRVLARCGALMAAASVVSLAWVGGRTPEAWSGLAALAAGISMGLMAAPTMGALYRTLPPELIPQGSSSLYMLNQLGGSLGIAAVAVIMQRSDGAVPGVHHGAWLLAGGLLTAAAITVLLPGRPARAAASPQVEREATQVS
ncbi:DHA2 family efflux MFS transporter permease subunit [Actinomadura harenae]|uniref:DHA2 family efflux MFS transporter permease subunit n=1 Tax=Actinomadura harenae TaxID=2483351 RepID=A0A3M2M8B6_9ACTN|nr:DHA2 family efflux MFS transporter permease subunit [Actinomadura harenae]RMI45729.1 DHA2 family efflux MFS transporter permease subunit [Actinomadura harenae]